LGHRVVCARMCVGRCSEIRQIYRTNVVSYICVVINSCLSVTVGFVVWFLYEPPEAAARTILYGVVGGLQLWIVFFANAVLLVGKARVSSCRSVLFLRAGWCHVQLADFNSRVSCGRDVVHENAIKSCPYIAPTELQGRPKALPVTQNASRKSLEDENKELVILSCITP